MGFTVSWSKLHPYTKENVDSEVDDDEKGGIYRLSFEKNSEENPTIFYVGRGKPLKKRLLDHFLDDEENECIKKELKNKCYFRFAYVSGPKSRACAERFMYDKWEPKCNKNVPDSDPCEINLK